MQRYLYHYCARHQEESRVVLVDGLLLCETPIDSSARYRDAKEAIGKRFNLPSVVITSLSFLGMTDRTSIEESSDEQ